MNGRVRMKRGGIQEKSWKGEEISKKEGRSEEERE